MNKKIPQIETIDLGVGGYGTDQIYLLFQKTKNQIKHSLIIVGLLMSDIDRAILKIRTSQKPYFILDQKENLVLKGTPIEIDQENFYKNYSLSEKSYFFAYLKRKYFSKDQKTELKKTINSKLIRLFQSASDTKNTQLLFVLFYSQHELRATDWREQFLKKELDKLHIPYIDTKKILLQYALNNSVELQSFYNSAPRYHHNNLGNQVIAEGIIKYLRENNLI